MEWMVAAVLMAVLIPVFGHFEERTPVARRMARWLAYLAVLFLVERLAGRPWTWLWVAGLPVLGTIFHLRWCLRNGIHPLTAEPRDRYHQLRGWTS